MSLDWNVSKVKDWEKLCFQDETLEELTGTTSNIVWATMAVHLGTITEKNVDDWMHRIGVLKKLGRELGRTIHRDGEKKTITPWWPSREDIEAHIGLRTNMSTKPFKSWTKMLMDNIVSDVFYETNKEKQKREEAKDAA